MQNLNMNTFPYYDDFDASKGFHRILFVPGTAVQARELTQVQTILQNQVKQFGNNIFTDGTVIFGCPESTNFKVDYIKLVDAFSSPSGQDIDNDSIEDYEGMTLIGANVGVQAIIKKAVAGTEAGPHKTFYLQYTVAGSDNVTTTFAANELITIVETNEIVVVADSPTSPVGFGSLFSVGAGIVYAKGYFVIHNEQTIVVDAFSTTPTKKVGFVIEEEIVTADDDVTLLDPARGSSNYTAPGAHRYKITTQLVAVDPATTAPVEFYILFDIEDGKIKRKYNVTQYGELNKTLARRTYDESGDYTVRAFPLIVQEHLNNGTNNGRYTLAAGGDAGKLAINVQPGKAYVKGFEQELFATEYLPIDKGIDTQSLQNQPVSTSYGYYVTADPIVGNWPINSSATIALSGGGLTATARVREIEHVTGTTHRIYLYDVRVTAGSLATLTTLTYAAGNGSATAVSSAIGGSKYPTSIFPSSQKNLSGFTDGSYVYRKVYSGVTVTAGAASVSVSGAESFAFTSTTTQNDIFIVKTGSPYTQLTFTSASVSGSTLNITGISGSPGTADIMVLVRKTEAENSKTLQKDQYAAFDAHGGSAPYSLGYYDVKEIQEVWVADVGASFPANQTALEADAAWELTSDFTFDNGQRDDRYDIATITPGSTWNGTWATKRVIIRLTYYAHGTGSPYYTVDSYPLPAVNAAPSSTEIEWHELPTYVSSTGVKYNLRECVDFRPTVQLSTSLPATTITIASGPSAINPVASTTFLSGHVNPAPQEEFIADTDFFLPRIDRIVVDTEGNFTTVTGVASLTPAYPRQPDNAMTLGYVFVAPYPSLSPYMAKVEGLPEYTCTVTQVDNRRYTMRDIGNINRRIDRLEYYTSLSLLEQNTANLLIKNGSGLDRFKNGILVDDFVGHNIGNVSDPAYKCSIGNSELHPFITMDNIGLIYDSGTVVRKADDAIIVVRQALVASDYDVGDVIDNGSGATGTVVHNVLLGTGNGWKWVRLYLSGVVGTFASGNLINIDTGSITAVDTGVLQDDVAPDLVVYPSNGMLATLPYAHKIYASNPYASKTRNVVSQLLFTYTGTMQLTPALDVWTDTSTLPEVQVNVGGTADNWAVRADAWGTEWGAWENVWQGVETTNTIIAQENIDSTKRLVTTETAETTLQRQQRQGTAITVTTSTSTTPLGNRVVSTALLPYMRSTLVSFSASGLKPRSTVYAYFDGVDVSANCRKTGDTYGNPLTVDINGNITGDFLIPAGRFAVGTKSFVLCDSQTSPLATDINTIAAASFTASGLSVVEQGTVLSTQTPQITVSQQTQTQDIVTARQTSQSTQIMDRVFDPIAQTFFVTDMPNGMLLTKADVYFRTKSSTAPITFQIREVVNGYPSETVVPYSTTTLHPKDVNISEDASAVTEFKFESPVYLKNNTEYCFVLLPVGNDENYNMWVAELGSTVIGTTERIDKQPAAGVLFVSANNNTWTAIQSEDIKFTLYRAEFTPNTSANIVLTSDSIDFVSLSSATGDFLVGDAVTFWSSTIIEVPDGTEYAVGDIIVTDETVQGRFIVQNVSSNTITLLPLVDSITVSSTLDNITQGSYGLTVSSITSSTAEVATGSIKYYDTQRSIAQVVIATGALTTATTMRSVTATCVAGHRSASVHALSPTIGQLDFNNTDITWTYSIQGSTAESLPTTGTTYLADPAAIRSTSVAAANDLEVIGTLITDVDSLSPVVDLSRVSTVFVANSISNVSSNETNAASGSALSKYISRRVILDDGFEAEDLNVYITADIPQPASIKVYAKLLNQTDPTAFENRPWTLLETASTFLPGQQEYLFTIPAETVSIDTTDPKGAIDTADDTYKYSTNFVGFKTFAVKIVLLSTNAAQPPVCYDMRAIALMA